MKITINGTEHETDTKTLTYEALCAMAGERHERNPSMVYRARMGADSQRSGMISAGREIAIVEGMAFEVVVTGSA